MDPPPDGNLDQLVQDPRFNDLDLDGRLGAIDKWYDYRSAGEDEQAQQGYEQDRQMAKATYQLKYVQQNDTPQMADLATQKLGAYQGLYAAIKNPDLDDVSRAGAFLDFRDASQQADSDFQAQQSRQQTLQSMVPTILQHRKIATMSGSDELWADVSNLTTDPQAKLYGPGGNIENQLTQNAGVSQDDINTAVSDFSKLRGQPSTGALYTPPKPQDANHELMSFDEDSMLAGQPTTPASPSFDTLSNGEVAWSPQGLLNTDAAKKDLANSNVPALAKQRALNNLDRQSESFVNSTYASITKGQDQSQDEVDRASAIAQANPQQDNYDNFQQAKKGILQDEFNKGKNSPYWSQLTAGARLGAVQAANMIPTISSAFTGGNIGEDTRKAESNKEQDITAQMQLREGGGIAGGASPGGLKLAAGVGTATPQLALQLGAGKVIGALATVAGATDVANVGFATSAAMGGFQSFSSSYNSALGANGNGDRTLAMGSALTSGAITTLTQAMGGKIGVNSVFTDPDVKKSLLEYYGSVLSHGSEAALIGLTDSTLNGMAASALRDPNKTFGDIAKDGVDSAALQFFMGSGAGVLHGRGSGEAPPVDNRPAGNEPVPDFQYDFDSPTTTASEPNPNQIQQGDDGKFTLQDPAFPQTFDNRADAENFAKTRYYDRFKQNVASQFDPDSAAMAAIEGIGKGLARSGVNPDTEFFANILGPQDVTDIHDRAVEADMKRRDAQSDIAGQVERNRNNVSIAGSSEGGLSITLPEKGNASPRPQMDVSQTPANTAEEVYRNTIEVPSQESTDSKQEETLIPKSDEIQSRLDELKAKENPSEDDQIEIENLEGLHSQAIMEENELSRRQGEPGYTDEDVAAKGDLGANVGQEVERAQRAKDEEQEPALRQRLAELGDDAEGTPEHQEITDKLADIEANRQTADENPPTGAPTQPSASPTPEVTKTVNDSIGELNARIGDMIKKANKNGADLDPRATAVKFFDRTGEYKSVVEGLRDAGHLDSGDADLLDSMGNRMNGLVDEWVRTRPDGPLRSPGTETSPDAQGLDQSQGNPDQEGKSGPRGRIQVLDPRVVGAANKLLIEGFKSGDTTTLLHEMMHAMDLMVHEPSGKNMLELAMGDKFDAFQKWRTKNGQISDGSTEAMERAAVGFEQYLATGKAPTQALDSTFSRLKSVFSSIYQNVRGLLTSLPAEKGGGIALNDAAIAAYDRLFMGNPAEGGPTGPQPVATPIASVQSNPEFKVAGSSATLVPLKDGSPQKGFKSAASAKAFRAKMAKSLGLNASVMKVTRGEAGKYFVYAYPSSSKSMGAAPIGNTGEASVVQDATGKAAALPDLAKGVAAAAGSTIRVDGQEKVVDPKQVSVETGPRGEAAAKTAILDYAKTHGRDVHEIGNPVPPGRNGLQPDGSTNAPFYYGKVERALPWRQVDATMAKHGIANFRYDTSNGQIEMYSMDKGDSPGFTDKVLNLTNDLNKNEGSTVIRNLFREDRSVRVHQAEGSSKSSDDVPGNTPNAARSALYVESGKWGRSVTASHATDSVVVQANTALANAGESGARNTSFNQAENDDDYIARAKALDDPMARWALASRMRGGTDEGLIPLRFATTGDPVVDSSLSDLAYQLRGSGRADYVLLGSHASSTGRVPEGIMPKDEQSLDEIALAKDERNTRALDQPRSMISSLDQIQLPEVLDHDIEKRVSEKPFGLSNFRIKPIADLFGKRFPLTKTTAAFSDNPLMPTLAAHLSYDAKAIGAANFVASELNAKYGDVWAGQKDPVTGEIVNFANGNVSPDMPTHVADVMEAIMRDPNSYPVSDKQRAYTAEYKGIINDLVKMAHEKGVMKFMLDDDGNIDSSKMESNNYVPRVVIGAIDPETSKVVATKSPSGRGGPVEERFFDKSRQFDTASEGIRNGIVYKSDPTDALADIVRSVYSKIGDVRTINDIKENSDPDKAQFSKGTRTVMVGKTDAVFDEATAKDIQEFYDKQSSQWKHLGTLNLVSGAVGLLKLGGDISTGIVRGTAFAFANPVRWAESFPPAFGRLFSKNGGYDFFQQRSAMVKEFVEAGGLFGLRNEYVKAAMNLGQKLAMAHSSVDALKGQTLDRLERFHKTFLDAGAISLWEANRHNALDENGNIDPDKARKVAMMCDSLMGRSSLARNGISKNGRGVLSLLTTAPGMYGAMGNNIGSLFSKDPIEQKLGWKYLSSSIVGMALAHLGAGAALGMKQDELEDMMTPSSNNFLKVKTTIGGDTYRVGMGGFYRSLIHTIGKISSVGYGSAFGGESHPMEDFYNPIINFSDSRISPFASGFMNWIRGVDYNGDHQSRARIAIEGLAPIALVNPAKWAGEKIANLTGSHGQIMTKDEMSFMDSSPKAVMLQTVGLDAYPVSRREQYYDTIKEQSEKIYGKSFNDLSPIEKISATASASAGLGVPPGLENFDLDKFLQRGSQQTRQYVNGDTEDVLNRVGLLDKGIPGPQSYKLPNGAMVPMSPDEKKAVTKSFGLALNRNMQPMQRLVNVIPDDQLKEYSKTLIKQSESQALLENGWPSQ